MNLKANIKKISPYILAAAVILVLFLFLTPSSCDGGKTWQLGSCSSQHSVKPQYLNSHDNKSHAFFNLISY